MLVRHRDAHRIHIRVFHRPRIEFGKAKTHIAHARFPALFAEVFDLARRFFAARVLERGLHRQHFFGNVGRLVYDLGAHAHVRFAVLQAGRNKHAVFFHGHRVGVGVQTHAAAYARAPVPPRHLRRPYFERANIGNALHVRVGNVYVVFALAR